jgi:hypothetical protein
MGNHDIDFYIFHHHFQIFRPKFLKFERGQNATEQLNIKSFAIQAACVTKLFTCVINRIQY